MSRHRSVRMVCLNEWGHASDHRRSPAPPDDEDMRAGWHAYGRALGREVKPSRRRERYEPTDGGEF